MNASKFESLNSNQHSRLSSAGIKGLVCLSKEWDLASSEVLSILGQCSEHYFDTRQDSPNSGNSLELNDIVLERLSLILGIHRCIKTLYPRSYWSSYVRAKNRKLESKSIVDVISTGELEKLYEVRYYLKASCQSEYL